MSLKFKHRIAQSAIRVLASTWRITLHGTMPQKPSVVAFWHGEMLPVWKLFSCEKNLPNVAIVSLSRDGEILSGILKHWGFDLLRGSSSRKSSDFLSEAVSQAKTSNILITPDGPRGPAKQFKAGAVIIAQRAGVDLFLTRIEVRSKKVFGKSWDEFILPLPFSKIEIYMENTGRIDPNLGKEETSKIIAEVETKLNIIGR